MNKSENATALIKKFKQGDTNALERLMLLAYKDLFYLSYSYLKDKMLAEDVVSDSFIKLIEKIETINSEKNCYAYLRAIAVNLSLDVIKKRKKEEITNLSDNESMFVCDGISEEDVLVREIISEMKEEEREVLILYSHDYTLKEIVEKTSKTINQVRLLIEKSKKTFSEKYQKSEEIKNG
ncbi:MAG: sigma-70 family RNA polymerase sigma factor [Firmicutes bacterium]|nr:sigma-70 family RNA polymerase sigma factor [Bacillota bacterium]